MIKELNEGKLPDQLKFFAGEEKGENLLKTQARKNVGVLSKGNEEFFRVSCVKIWKTPFSKKKKN